MRLGKELYHFTEQVFWKFVTPTDDIAIFFSQEIFGNLVSKLLFSVFTFFIFFLLRKNITSVIQYLLVKLSKALKLVKVTPLINTLYKPIKWIVLFVGFNISLSVLDFDNEINKSIVSGSQSFRIFLLTWILFLIVDFLYAHSQEFWVKKHSQSYQNFMNLSKKFIKITISIIAVIFILAIWNYNVNGLIASLGLAGMAVALAAQDTTKNIFGALMIFGDMPFRVGDWVKTPEVEGYVEAIGMRSTKVRTFEDALVSIPNGVIANVAITNWSAMQKRRIKMTLGLTYATTPAQMKKILQEMRELLRNDADIDQHTILINFSDYQDSSLGIFCYFFTKSTAWAEYLNVKERINLEFMRIVYDNGASFAFPSQSLYIEKNSII
jgi:MscS family membrane protein